MKTTLIPVRSLDRAERRLSELRSDSGRLSTLDRLSLHAGLWFLLRSARRNRRMTHEEYARHRAAERARQDAERERTHAAFGLWYLR